MTITSAQGERIAFVRPAANTDVLAFTATLNIEVTRIFVCNQAAAGRTFRIYHVPSGGSPGADYGLFWDAAIAANTTFDISAVNDNSGIQLKDGEALYVRSNGAADVAFQIYGVSTPVAPENA